MCYPIGYNFFGHHGITFSYCSCFHLSSNIYSINNLFFLINLCNHSFLAQGFLSFILLSAFQLALKKDIQAWSKIYSPNITSSISPTLHWISSFLLNFYSICFVLLILNSLQISTKCFKPSEKETLFQYHVTTVVLSVTKVQSKRKWNGGCILYIWHLLRSGKWNF